LYTTTGLQIQGPGAPAIALGSGSLFLTGPLYIAVNGTQWIWPLIDGASGNVFMTDGAGNLGWSGPGTTVVMDTAIMSNSVLVGQNNLSDADITIQGGNKTFGTEPTQLNIMTIDSEAHDVGGSLKFGGVVDDGGGSTAYFGAIAGRKINDIQDDLHGYLEFGVNDGDQVHRYMYLDYLGLVLTNNLTVTTNTTLNGKLNINTSAGVFVPSSNFVVTNNNTSGIQIQTTTSSTLTMSTASFTAGDILIIQVLATSHGSVSFMGKTLSPSSTGGYIFYCINNNNASWICIGNGNL
jgi:hypothetical protein